MNISEDSFVSWAKGPGKTETDKCENAESIIRKAIAADATLSRMNISVFAQGSYRYRTNIRQDSDVDIAVRLNNIMFADYPAGKTASDFGNGPADITFKAYKTMVGNALSEYLGRDGVTPGNKAFDVHANTYRIDADVVPTFEYRYYTGNGHDYLSGISFHSDKGVKIINWPDQNYDNGVKRNEETGRSHKRVIRILKRLRNEMQEAHIQEANNVASFLIESLVWNASLSTFKHNSYTEIVRDVIVDVWRNTQKDETCANWGEVNERKYLFRQSQPWTREQANKFLSSAWNYIGYK